MMTVALTLNGRAVESPVEPRTHLADFLREQQGLTGTHLGCEHGVCGACTVLIDSAPARSCITYAAACAGARVTTIEGLDDDPVAARLRDAFKRHHGLQCGYCTPGMLVTCRDIVMRLPDADERRVRSELAGNLCRCTGYQGIVAAVMGVLAHRRDGSLQVALPERRLGPIGAGHAAPEPARRHGAVQPAATTPEGPASTRALSAEDWAQVEQQGMRLEQSFEVAHPPDRVWQAFADPEALATCMPGARLTRVDDDGTVAGEVVVRLGPIAASFAGTGAIERDDDAREGTVRGIGSDRRSASRVRGIVGYRVLPAGSEASRVEVAVVYLLAGPLAQFSRGGIVQDVANRLARAFATNLEGRLAGREAPADASGGLNAGSLAWAVVRDRVSALVCQLLGRSDQPPR
jgi:aerobic carbon-monoxide dehydrogenase small subunit